VDSPADLSSSAGFRPGVRIGVDVGDVRIGVASCDRDALIATPLETVSAGPAAVSRIVGIAVEAAAIEVVVGFPRSLSGGVGPAADKARAFAGALVEEFAARGEPVLVRLVDERLTTVSAERVLRERGRKGARRRSVVDQVAAVVILQHAIDSERSAGRPPGEEVGHSS
jgi:putative Holliday junction resolvase